MEPITVLWTILASIFYMALFFVVKKADEEKDMEFDKKKAFRTIFWGLVVGIALAIRGVKPTMALTRATFLELSSYGALVILSEKGYLFFKRRIWARYLAT